MKGMLLDKRMLRPLVLEGEMRTAKIVLMVDGRTVTTDPVQQVFFVREEGEKTDEEPGEWIVEVSVRQHARNASSLNPGGIFMKSAPDTDALLKDNRIIYWTNIKNLY